MKKVISINFKGRVIPIEEDAFEILQRYIESLRQYFSKEEGRDEIINDIEDRIAELFSEALKKGATCITEANTNQIISNMGRVEDFEGEASETEASAEANHTKNAEPRGNIKRSANDKVLGGVCAGLAHYLKIDPTILRIIFAVVTFGGFGIGVVVYIVLWAVLPEQLLPPNIKKRVFRDPEHKVIGGVAAGIAAYFNIAVWIPRIIFLLPAVLSVFGGEIFAVGLGGTMFITYIVLWIVLPVAKSGLDKLQMRGEKIDLHTISSNVKEEMESLKGRAEKIGEDIKQSASQFTAQTTPVAQQIGNAIGILFKGFFLFIGGVFVLALLITLFSLLFAGVGIFPLKDFLFESGIENVSAWGTLLFFLLVPAISLLVWLIRKIVSAKSNPYLSYTFGVLWLIGWVSVCLLATLMVKNFSYEATVEKTIDMKSDFNTPLVISVNEDPLRYSGTYWWLQSNAEGWDINEDSLKYANIKVVFERATDSVFKASVVRCSFGANKKEAENRAEKIQFSAYQEANNLYLGNAISLSKHEKFRAQQVLVVVQVPVGKKVRIDESVEEKLYPIYVRVNEKGKWNRRNRIHKMDWDEDVEYKTGVDYIMTENGLVEIDERGNMIKPAAAPNNNITPPTQIETEKPGTAPKPIKQETAQGGAKPIADAASEPYEWYMFRSGK
ncbi:MAG: PspC domain-containing protein [Chitinophagaceae bacterium]